MVLGTQVGRGARSCCRDSDLGCHVGIMMLLLVREILLVRGTPSCYRSSGLGCHVGVIILLVVGEMLMVLLVVMKTFLSRDVVCLVGGDLGSSRGRRCIVLGRDHTLV
jgi:hypothetical protein